MTSDKTMVEEMTRAIADVIWPLADWDGERAVAETAAGKAAQAAATIAQRRVEELECILSNTVALARIKWGNLDADANALLAEADAALNPKGGELK